VFWFSAANLLFYCTTFFILGFFVPLNTAIGKIPEWEYTVLYFSNWFLYGFYFISILVDRNNKSV
ncbi:MAG TPA: hypothetical protein VD905_01630, partial [Flavobacteriales bacterium]|nr:hypothetical protein [Flavobacteriales bacterium]